MKQEIVYSGITRNTSDSISTDGELADCVNMLCDNGEMKPLIDNHLIINDPNYNLICIHSVKGIKNWILHKDTLVCWPNGDKTKEFVIWGSIPNDLTDVKIVGNVLCVFVKNNPINYFLYKNETYKHLGEKIPETDIEINWSIDKSSVYPTSTKFYTLGDFTHVSLSSNNDINKIGISSDGNYSEWVQNNTNTTNVILAKIQDIVKENTKEGYLSTPVMIRWAYKMYDGSYTHHSSPILVDPSFCTIEARLPYFSTNDFSVLDRYGTSKSPITTALKFKWYQIAMQFYKVHAKVISNTLADWGDIIQSVDFFMSEPLYNMDMSGLIGYAHPFDVNGSNFTYQSGSNIYGDDLYGKANYNNTYRYSLMLPYLKDEDFIDKIKDTSIFYKVKSVDIKSLSGIINLEEVEEIRSQEKLSDDFESHCAILAENGFTYNNRLHVFDYTKSMHDSFFQRSTNYHSDTSGNTDFYIEFEDGSVLKQTVKGIYNFPHFFFYPDPKAIKVYMFNSAKKQEYYLAKHDLLNGAYYINPTLNKVSSGGDGSWNPGGDIVMPPDVPTVKDNRRFSANKIIVSNAYNPFLFDAANTYEFPTNRIVGIATTTKALSQGQFGQFPLYVFTEDGIWAMEVNTTGTFSSKQIVSRDVCISAKSITQLDGAVSFVTSKGLMVLQGSDISCISDVMTGKNFRADNLPDLRSGYPIISDDSSFADYIKSASFGYDYPNSLLYISNDQYDYQYIYSLKYSTFCKYNMGKRYLSFVNAYPDTYINTNAGISVMSKAEDINDVNERTKGVIISRPFKFGDSSVSKSISRLYHRGEWIKGAVKVDLYGSNNGSSYYKINSLRGMPYKYFRTVVYAYMLPTESITRIEAEFEPRRSTRLR